MTSSLLLSPGSRFLRPFRICRLGGQPHRSLFGIGSRVEVRLGQGSVVGVSDLDVLGAEYGQCTVLLVYKDAVSRAFMISSALPSGPPWLQCAEVIGLCWACTTHHDCCKSSSPPEPRHCVCAFGFGGLPYWTQYPSSCTSSRPASSLSVLVPWCSSSGFCEVQGIADPLVGLLWASVFTFSDGGLRCTSVAQGCTPICCQFCTSVVVAAFWQTWGRVLLWTLLYGAFLLVGVALLHRGMSVVLGFLSSWEGHIGQLGWVVSALEIERVDCWGHLGFFLVLATVLLRLHPAVVDDGGSAAGFLYLLPRVETQAVSLLLTFGLLVLGQLLALQLRALGFHRTLGGRCLLWCDTSAVAPLLCSLAAASCVSSGPLQWDMDASSVGRSSRPRRQSLLTEGIPSGSRSYSVLRRPSPEITPLLWFGLGLSARTSSRMWALPPEDLETETACDGVDSVSWMCICSRGSSLCDAFAEGCLGSTTASPDTVLQTGSGRNDDGVQQTDLVVPFVPVFLAKLDQEPASLSLEGRASLERIRDMPGPAARPWPTVPACG